MNAATWKTYKSPSHRGAWLAQSAEHSPLDLWAVSSSHTLSVVPTLQKSPSHKARLPTSRSLLTADRQHVKGKLKVIHSAPHWGPEMEGGTLGVPQPYLHSEARYAAGVTFYARSFLARPQVPLLSVRRRDDWLDFPSTN